MPGVGLSRPVPDGKNDEEPGVENRLVLCSAKVNKFQKFQAAKDNLVCCVGQVRVNSRCVRDVRCLGYRSGGLPDCLRSMRPMLPSVLFEH